MRGTSAASPACLYSLPFLLRSPSPLHVKTPTTTWKADSISLYLLTYNLYLLIFTIFGRHFLHGAALWYLVLLHGFCALWCLRALRKDRKDMTGTARCLFEQEGGKTKGHELFWTTSTVGGWRDPAGYPHFAALCSNFVFFAWW